MVTNKKTDRVYVWQKRLCLANIDCLITFQKRLWKSKSKYQTIFKKKVKHHLIVWRILILGRALVYANLTIGITCYRSCSARISRGAILWSNYAARSNTLFPFLARCGSQIEAEIGFHLRIRRAPSGTPPSLPHPPLLLSDTHSLRPPLTSLFECPSAW